MTDKHNSPRPGESVDALDSKIESLLRTTPLKTRLKVSNWMEFVDLIVSLGYRENKAWGDDENELNYKITLAADKYADRIIETVAEFYKDASVDAEPSQEQNLKLKVLKFIRENKFYLDSDGRWYSTKNRGNYSQPPKTYDDEEFANLIQHENIT